MAEPDRPLALDRDPTTGLRWSELVDRTLDRAADLDYVSELEFARLTAMLNDIDHPRVQLAYLRAELFRLEQRRSPLQVLVACRTCGNDDGLQRVSDPAADPVGAHGAYRPCPDCRPLGFAAWHADHTGCRRRDCDTCRSLRFGGSGAAAAAAAKGGSSWLD